MPRHQNAAATAPADDSHADNASDDQLAGKFESVFGFPALKLAQPGMQVYLRKVAEFLGKQARKNIPSSSFLRSDIMEFIAYVGALKIGVGGSIVRGAIGEFVTAFAQTFCGGEHDDDSAESRSLKGVAPEYLKMFVTMDEKLHTQIVNELPTITEADMDSAEKMFERWAKVLWTAKQTALHGPEKPAARKRPSVPLKTQIAAFRNGAGEVVDETLQPLNAELATLVAKGQASNDALRRKLAARPRRTPTRMERFFKWLIK